MCFTIFFAFFFRNTDEDKEAAEHIGDEELALADDQLYLHSPEVCALFLVFFSAIILLTEQLVVY